MEPEPVDLTFVPTRRTDVTEIPAGAELLVVDESGGEVHLLNPTAALIWSFADGRGSLADFVADLAEELEVDPEAIGADLLAWADDLGRRGLLRTAIPQARTDPTAKRTDGGAPTTPWRLTGGPHPGLDARFDPASSWILTVVRDDVQLRIRVDDADLAGVLATALTGAGLAVDPPARSDDGGTEALYSVLVGRHTGPAVGLHRLHRGSRPLRRCRHTDDLVRVTVADVEALFDRVTGRRPLLDVVGLEKGTRLLALEPGFAAIVDDLEPRLRRVGITRVDPSFVALAPCDPPRSLVGLILRPGASVAVPGSASADPDEAADREHQVATVTLASLGLARGPDGTLSGACVTRLHEVVRSTEVVRVPGRDALLREVLTRLP